MASYIEYCPLGRTDKTIEFKIDDSRDPSPTTPCICSTETGIGSREELGIHAQVALAFGDIASAIDLARSAKQFAPAAQPHSSALMKVINP